eukprot:86307-Rhodomonas_salina.1
MQSPYWSSLYSTTSGGSWIGSWYPPVVLPSVLVVPRRIAVQKGGRLLGVGRFRSVAPPPSPGTSRSTSTSVY